MNSTKENDHIIFIMNSQRYIIFVYIVIVIEIVCCENYHMFIKTRMQYNFYSHCSSQLYTIMFANLCMGQRAYILN